ncbi:MAG: hypothetical protein ACK4VK_07965 [Aquificaceae bacterium]
MKKLGFIMGLFLALALLQSCQSNPCASEPAIEKAKEGLALKILMLKNPEKFFAALFSSAISFLTSEGVLDETLKKEIDPIVKEIKVRDINKPIKKAEKEYICNAFLEYQGNKNLVEYMVKEIEVGKEKVYKVEVLDINKVE